MTENAEKHASDFEREKWIKDCEFREREIKIKEEELARSRWLNPLVIAIISAALLAGGNILQNYLTAKSRLSLETFKAEADRILEVIKTNNDPDKAAANLEFLVEAGLIKNPSTRTSIETYIKNRKPGQGVALPSARVPDAQPLGMP
jgi:hypothetical protein